MSGRTCAYGLYFQYLVSLRFLLDMLDEPERLRLRVDPSGDDGEPSSGLHIVDLDVARSDGTRTLAVQVKSAVDPDTAPPISAPDLADWFRQLVASGHAENYQVVTNRRLTEPAQRLAQAFEEGDLAALEHAWPGTFNSDFADDTSLCLAMKCRVVREHRSSAELLRVLRARIKELRICARAGTGDESAGLLTIYLVGQLFHRGSGDHPDLVSVEEAQQWLRISPADLAHSVRRYDWGIPIGVRFPGAAIRTSKLAELIGFFEQPQHDRRESRLVVVHGLSGLGKSTLGAQYACDYADHYDFMWWVDCESESSIDFSLKRLVSTIPSLEWGEEGPSLDALPAALSQFPGRWLIVADNVYDRGIVTPWLPTVGCGDIIVTTVDGTLWPHEYRIDLNRGFTDEESQEFLSGQLPALQADTDLLRELAETLEHWPLALSMAAAYLINAQRDLRQTPRGHLEKFRSAIIRTASAVDGRRYPRTLAAAISLVLRQVRDRAGIHPLVDGYDVGRLAIHGLVAAAYCAESDIPVEILWPSVFDDRNSGEPGNAAIVSDAVVALLHSGSLVQRTQLIHQLSGDYSLNDRITVNLITQDVIRSEIEAENPQTVTAQFVSELCFHVGQILQPAVHYERFRTIAAMSSHAEHVALHANRLDVLNPELAALHGNLALAFEKRGRFVDAIALLEQELAILDGLTDAMTLIKVKTLTQLSYVLIQAGKPFEEILARLTETVEAVERYVPESSSHESEHALQWINLQAIVDGLRQHESDPPVVALRARVDRGVNGLPATSGDPEIDGKISCVVEAKELSGMLRRSGREREVIDRARIAFRTCRQHDIRIRLLGLQVEAHAYLGDTSSVLRGMRELELFAQPMEMCVETFVDALQNAALAITPQLDMSAEYQHVLCVVVEQSEQRMPLAPPNPNLRWFHHVLSARYFAHIGDSDAARTHLDAASRRRPNDQGVKRLTDWEQILAEASRRI